MNAGKPFSIYRIICTITDAALVSGSDWPNYQRQYHNKKTWYHRGSWTRTGSFWRTEHTIKRHLWALSHDWETMIERRFYGKDLEHDYVVTWHERITDKPDWTRLDHLIVEETVVQAHTVSEHSGRDFMGIRLEEFVP